MAMAQNNRNPRIPQKAFEVVTDGSGFNAVKEVTGAIAARLQLGGALPFIGQAGRFELSNERAINCDEPFKRYGGVLIKECFGGAGARPFIGQADRLERSNARAINCDEAFQRYGGLLMKNFRN